MNEWYGVECIKIAVTTDNKYVTLLAALIKSIEKTLHKNYSIELTIIEQNVSIKNKKKLHESINPKIISLKWVGISSLFKRLSLPVDQSTFPITTYGRLLLEYVYPPQVSRVIYLDVDTVLLESIHDLWELDLQDKTIGAARDELVKTFQTSWNGGIVNYKQLGLAGDSEYFNAGVMVIDLVKWRSEKVAENVVHCIEKNKAFANFPDQYGLNIVLNKRWLKIDVNWNYFSALPYHSGIKLVHFISDKPIYSSYNGGSEFLSIFKNYLGETSWEFRQSPGVIVQLNKLMTLIRKRMFFKRLFLKFFNPPR